MSNKPLFFMMKFILLFLMHQAELSAAAVEDEIHLDANGTELFIEVRGEKDNAPLILFLHGGPGNVALGIVAFQAKTGMLLEKNFLVAYLHQRGAGHSMPLPSSEQTVTNHINDVNTVVGYLLKRYGKNKIYLAGHSWGGMLSALYMEKHPENLGGIIFISSAMNFREMLNDSLALTKEWARENNMEDAVESLGQINTSFATRQDFFSLSRWANQANGGITAYFDIAEFMEENRINEEFPDWGRKQSEIMNAMFDELVQLNMDEAIDSFNIPALFVSGIDDTIIPTKTVRRDYDNYGGEKKFVLLQNSHHLPFMDQPDILSQVILDFLYSLE